MLQQHPTHPAGTFPRCSGCGREPMHIVCTGASTRDTDGIAQLTAVERHQLECNRCGRFTARHPSLGAARAEWSVTFAHPVTPMRVVSSRDAAPKQARSNTR